MPRLISFVSNELDRNAYFFSTLEGNMFAALDFIKYVVKDESFLKLSEEDKKFVNRLELSYGAIKECCTEIRKEIGKYKLELNNLFDHQHEVLEKDLQQKNNL